MMRFCYLIICLTLQSCFQTKKPYSQYHSYWIYEGCHTFLDTLDIQPVGYSLFEDTHKNIYFKSYNPEDNKVLLIKNIYYGCKEDSLNYQQYELKNKIDIATFSPLQNSYYSDKNHLFYFFMNSDGGHFYILDSLEYKTLHIFPKSHFLIHRNNVYYMGQIIENADYKTFQPIYKDTLFTFFGRDKKNYFKGLDICLEQEAK
ncbi:hypothetical protein AD998_18770 [bacterium 336/3]|nr:hypothetical protein AD998_18770 [bacterium 336/3]